jgi:hypothetical protein
MDWSGWSGWLRLLGCSAQAAELSDGWMERVGCCWLAVWLLLLIYPPNP